MFVFIGLAVVIDGRLGERGMRGGFLLAHAAMIFPGIEYRMQPRHHLLDRGQLARRPLLAARAGFALRPLFALEPGFAPRALRTRLARRAGLAWGTGLARN